MPVLSLMMTGHGLIRMIKHSSRTRQGEHIRSKTDFLTHYLTMKAIVFKWFKTIRRDP